MSTAVSSDLKILACSLLGLTAAAALPAVAAPADASSDVAELTEVVVTANKLNAASAITVGPWLTGNPLSLIHI